jgi:membrane-associated phospholipid phosphatase
LKDVFQIRRPPLPQVSANNAAVPAKPKAAATVPAKPNWGFPSGHSLGSMVGYGLLAYLLVRLVLLRRSARLGVVALAILLVLTIGFSRLYLHAHYLSQVLGGFAFGIFWLSLTITVMEVLLRRAGTVARPGEAERRPSALINA